MTRAERIGLEMQIYMCSHEPVIKWLEEQGCETVDDALYKMKPFVDSNMLNWAAGIGRGEYGGSLAGTAHCVEKIAKHFKKKEDEKTQENSVES